MAMIRIINVLILLVIQDAAAVTHSLKYFQTATSGIPNFPTFVSVVLVDDVQISQCDSITNEVVPKQDWVNRVTEVDSQYWDRQTVICRRDQKSFQAYIEITKQRFNQTGGVHIYQRMYSCEWDEETQNVTCYEQHGYDGEDWLVWDVKTKTWIAPQKQAELTKNEWNNNKFKLAERKNCLYQECPEWLKKYVDYGNSSLMRTDLPSVSFLQKSSSSPISCHATGFYPNRAEMFWRKDGEEIHDGVDKGEILPNNDGTFQMTVDLHLSSAASEDMSKYECVFQLSGVKEDIPHGLEKTRILTNESNTINPIIIAAVAVVLLGLIVVIGFILYKNKNKNIKKDAQDTKSSTSSLSSDKSDESKRSASSDQPLLQ